MKSRDRGVTLLEMILTVALFALVLSVIASLLSGAAKVARRADVLSWSNQASRWLDRIEFDTISSRSLNVSPGGNDIRLELSVRDLDSVNFLPDPPPDPWNPDAPASLESRVYEIQSQNLILTTTSTSLGIHSYTMGAADAFVVDCSATGELTLTIRRGDEQVKREVPPLLLDSERAPL